VNPGRALSQIRSAAAAAGVGFAGGMGKLYEPRAGATKVSISRVQAFQRYARQEAASAITQSPKGPDAWEQRSGAKTLEASAQTNETKTGRRDKLVSVRRGRG
jgi:hypothetical protein